METTIEDASAMALPVVEDASRWSFSAPSTHLTLDNACSTLHLTVHVSILTRLENTDRDWEQIDLLQHAVGIEQ